MHMVRGGKGGESSEPPAVFILDCQIFSGLKEYYGVKSGNQTAKDFFPTTVLRQRPK